MPSKPDDQWGLVLFASVVRSLGIFAIALAVAHVAGHYTPAANVPVKDVFGLLAAALLFGTAQSLIEEMHRE